jgi:hypothetical protein
MIGLKRVSNLMYDRRIVKRIGNVRKIAILNLPTFHLDENQQLSVTDPVITKIQSEHRLDL